MMKTELNLARELRLALILVFHRELTHLITILYFHVMRASNRHSLTQFSTEAGLNNCLIGAFSSGILLFGNIFKVASLHAALLLASSGVPSVSGPG